MQDNNVKLALAAHGEELLDVRHFSVSESMSGLFDVQVYAVSHDDDVDLDSIVGKGAALRIETQNYKAKTKVCVWAGLVEDMTQVHVEASGVSGYHLRIVPLLWRTTLRRNCRIFQHLTTPEILTKLLAEWQITPVSRLKGEYKKLEYCVQYGETDFAFFSRLLEDAGISFYFTHVETSGTGAEVTKLVLDDSPASNAQRPGTLMYAGQQAPRFGASEEFCAAVRISQRVQPGKFLVRDHDFRLRTDTPLLAKTSSGTHEDVYEQYHYAPGAFWRINGESGDTPVADDKGPARTDSKESSALVTRTKDAKRRQRLSVTFDSNALDLAPGTVLAINQSSSTVDHPRADLAPDKKLLVLESHIQGTHDGDWRKHVSAVFAETPHRPQPRTPRPRILGMQSAVVVGPKGSEIHTDEFGRVRVQFHWDREGKYDDNSSCWMRVSQSTAGGGFGVVNIPRVGHEVLVSFLEGDPDRPLITGRVYNDTTRVPYALPQNKTQSGWKTDSSPGGGGYNELMFEDKKGSELIRIQAEKDLSYVIKHSETGSIGSARSTLIGESETLHVGSARTIVVGHTDLTSVGDLHEISVGKSTGIKMSKEEVIIVSTGAASIKLSGGDIFLNAKGGIHLHAEKELHLSSATGDVVIQGGPKVLINDGDKGESPEVDHVDPAKLPSPPMPGGTSAPPYVPSGGGTIPKPGALADDVTV